MSISAYDFEAGGIYYNILAGAGMTCEVTSDGNGNVPCYSGNVVIPSTVANGNVTYSVTSIGENAFKGCTGLTNVTIPNTVTAIGTSAFYECSGLDNVVIPNSVASIGWASFGGCDGLTTVIVPSSVTNIGRGAFTMCSNLKEILVDGDNAVFTSYAGVLYNKNMSTILECPCGKTGVFEIPASVTTVGEGAFYANYRLTGIKIPNTVTAISDWAFQGCSNITGFNIPHSVKSIGEQAFADCSRLKSITLPNSLTTVSEWMFMRCHDLETIVFPASVMNIGERLCFRCPNLTDIYSLAAVPPTAAGFDLDASQYQTVTVYVPKGSLQSYRDAAVWSMFADIQEIDPTGIAAVTADGGNGKVVYYDMQGRKFSVPQQGLNIINGKKVLIKK